MRLVASPSSPGQFVCPPRGRCCGVGTRVGTCPQPRQHSKARPGQDLATLEPLNPPSLSTATGMGTVTGPPQDPDPGGHYQFRVIVLGDAAVGKSSLLRCFAEGPGGGTATPCPTVGVEFYSRTVPLPPAGRAKLQLWDTAGQERFR